MSIGRIGRVGRLARVSKGGDVLGGHDIISITDGTIVALVTTAKPHGIAENGEVVISGSSVVAYNSPTTAINVTATTFRAEDLEYTEDATGGRWD